MSKNPLNRREFMRYGAGAAAMAVGNRFAFQPGSLRAAASPLKPTAPRSGATLNLVPEKPGKTPSYWCTWGLQNYTLDNADENNHSMVANNLTEEQLFGHPGWVANYFQKVRADLYVLFDLGWDVPPGLQFDRERWRLGTLELATGKFPSCTGTPTERLRKLDERTKAAGWRGAGIWVAAQAPGDGRDGRLMDDKALEAYFRERARWTRDAGIGYWKVDYGARGGNPDFRRLVSRIAREEAPGLLVEHGRGCGPVNDEVVSWEKLVANKKGSYRSWDNGRILQQAVELISFSDVLRTYDVTAYFSVPTTLDRVAQILAEAARLRGGPGLVNCEDEPFIAAALGCALGVMRHPLARELKNKPYDPYQVKKRSDEMTRAVRWQRLAPAVRAGKTKVLLDSSFLLDHWVFKEGETWATWLFGQEAVQGAPARVARGMALPKVKADGPAPYVIASRHPQGAIAVATLPRISKDKGFYLPRADVAIDIGDGDFPVGVFGRYRTLTLSLSGRLGARHIWAQDLAGDEATDITEKVVRAATSITLPGESINSIGLSAATPGDLSEPGLVLQVI
ncbi:MAG: hypothetical protein ABSA70_14970 [Terriglobia bacterium]